MKQFIPYFPRFIAQRISSHEGTSFSRLIMRIAIGSVAIGMATVILSFVIFAGFKHTIQEKIFSFSGHIQLAKYTEGDSYEAPPVSLSASIYQNTSELKELDHIQRYSYKAGLLKTEEDVMGLVFKGIGTDFDTQRFDKNMLEGQGLQLSNTGKYSTDILISKRVANKMQLKLNDEVAMYFVQDPPKFRKLTVTGIYNTGIEDFDDLFIMGDHRLVQRLNNWEDSLVGGFELFISDFDRLSEAYEEIVIHKDYYLNVDVVTRKYGHLFDWFLMVNQHVKAILAIILSVASFNVISVMLITIIERTEMIGTLKALGATNKQLRQVFLLKGVRIAGKGLLLGNAIGIGLSLLQRQFQVIPLDPENYYMNAVPILLDWSSIILFNLIALVMVVLILLIPTFIIGNISPIKAIKFD